MAALTGALVDLAPLRQVVAEDSGVEDVDDSPVRRARRRRSPPDAHLDVEAHRLDALGAARSASPTATPWWSAAPACSARVSAVISGPMPTGSPRVRASTCRVMWFLRSPGCECLEVQWFGEVRRVRGTPPRRPACRRGLGVPAQMVDAGDRGVDVADEAALGDDRQAVPGPADDVTGDGQRHHLVGDLEAVRAELGQQGRGHVAAGAEDPVDGELLEVAAHRSRQRQRDLLGVLGGRPAAGRTRRAPWPARPVLGAGVGGGPCRAGPVVASTSGTASRRRSARVDAHLRVGRRAGAAGRG